VADVSILFCDPAGSYADVPDLDLWPESRDARKYTGPNVVVAHPPCHLWVNMAAVNFKRYVHTPAWYPGGSDGGCFSSALASVLQFGGVLEHPAFTHAWGVFGLPTPTGVGWTEHLVEARRYWVCEVWQSAYGHKARKRTWLLYSGARPPPELRWDRKPGTHQIGWFDRNKPTLGKRQANATPPEFRDALIELARWSRG